MDMLYWGEGEYHPQHLQCLGVSRESVNSCSHGLVDILGKLSCVIMGHLAECLIMRHVLIRIGRQL